AGAEAFDVAQPFRVERTRQRVLLPTRALAARVKAVAADTGASLVVLDPAVPLGVLGPRLGLPYAVVVHGAEVSVPGRVPGAHSLLARVLADASHVVAAGRWVADQAERAAGTALPTTVVPPGVDVDRFRPLSPDDRSKARASLGLPAHRRLVFIEGAACGVPQVAGDSGGAGEAVVDGETGFVVGSPRDAAASAQALARLLDDADLRQTLGEASRRRAEAQFSYDVLAARLDDA